MELEEAIERAIRHIATEKKEFPIEEINDYLIANGIINERMDPRAIFRIAEPILPVLGFERRGTYAGIIVEQIDEGRYIKETLKEAKDTHEQIKKEDTYLIYSVKKDITNRFKQYLNDLSSSDLRKRLSQDEFNSLVGDEYVNYYNQIVSITKKVRNFNSEFIKRRMKEYDYLFKKSPYPLDNDQKTAVIVDDKHNLVIAGAGSGKTEVLITRIAYFIERKPDTVKPDRILALAFQNKAKTEIQERLNERYGLDVTIKTFHAFGKEILEKATKKSKKGVPELKFSGDNYDKEHYRFIETLFQEAQENFELRNDLINYAAQYDRDEDIKKDADFETKENYYSYMRNLTYTTLDGTKVKSEAERAIMNFFVSHKLNGKKVNILYENPASWMKYRDEKGEHIPKPDFFLPEHDSYIEHLAVNKEGKVPDWFEGDDPTNDYKKTMKAKQKKFQEQDKYVLVETTQGDFEEKNFLLLLEKRILKALEEKYPGKRFTFTPLSYDELVGRVWDECQGSLKAVPLNISRFINIAKTYSLTPDDIKRRLSRGRWSPKQEAFAKIAIKLYKLYEEELRSANQIDFGDMINLAVKELNENENLYRNVFDHILIDEYQDISTQRYNLIKVLMDKNPDCKLFCVGDDWQSIMGFTGSNLDFFVDFGKYFDHPARTDLTTNYRSFKSIVDAGAEIIKNNGDAQLKKKTIAYNGKIEPIKVYSSLHQKEYWKQYYDQIARHCVDKIAEYRKRGYKWRDMMILCRIVNRPKMIKSLTDYATSKGVPISRESNRLNHVSLMSVHGSKGLQARVVFILNVDKGLYGFPCELENPAIFEPAITGRKKDREEEERRLFYVAVTRAKEEVIIYNQKCAASKFLGEIQNHTVLEYLSY
jgi:DNA helicase-4